LLFEHSENRIFKNADEIWSALMDINTVDQTDAIKEIKKILDELLSYNPSGKFYTHKEVIIENSLINEAGEDIVNVDNNSFLRLLTPRPFYKNGKFINSIDLANLALRNSDFKNFTSPEIDLFAEYREKGGLSNDDYDTIIKLITQRLGEKVEDKKTLFDKIEEKGGVSFLQTLDFRIDDDLMRNDVYKSMVISAYMQYEINTTKDNEEKTLKDIVDEFRKLIKEKGNQKELIALMIDNIILSGSINKLYEKLDDAKLKIIETDMGPVIVQKDKPNIETYDHVDVKNMLDKLYKVC
jgi:hypothetical protein